MTNIWWLTSIWPPKKTLIIRSQLISWDTTLIMSLPNVRYYLDYVPAKCWYREILPWLCPCQMLIWWDTTLIMSLPNVRYYLDYVPAKCEILPWLCPCQMWDTTLIMSLPNATGRGYVPIHLSSLQCNFNTMWVVSTGN